MKYFSMFSGIGGFEKGIENAFNSHKQSATFKQNKEGRNRDVDEDRTDVLSSSRSSPFCIGYSEVDKYATKIYQKHFPNHKAYGNATRIIPEEMPDFDFLCGGFPCQAFSIAGKRGGFKDTRGTLFFEIARIVAIKRPKLLLLENVAGLLSHDKGRTFGTILTTISDLGYFCEWQILNSKDFGVPQNRERVFIIGHFGKGCGRKIFPIEPSYEQYSSEMSSTAIDANYFKGIDNHGARTGIMQLNNPVHSNDRIYGKDGISPALNTAQGGNRQPKIRELSKYQGDYVHQPEEVMSTIPAQGGNKLKGLGLQQKDMRIRRLTPTECERLQGFPDGWTKDLSDSQRYKCLGNAVTVNVIENIINKLILTDCLG